MKRLLSPSLLLAALPLFASNALDLNGPWAFRFEEGRPIEAVAGPGFAATDVMCVPGCFDAMPRWQTKRGTGLYRKTFSLDAPVSNAWLVVDGMGLRGSFRIDGKDLGTHPYPYARLELETGPLAAGTHTLFAAIDNRIDWATTKLVQHFYDFYPYGGFYRGVKLVFDNRRLQVRTRDYRTGEVELAVVAGGAGIAVEGPQTLAFDGTNVVKAVFRNGRATVRVPAFRLWSPEAPALHTVTLGPQDPSPVRARFGIRTVEARDRKLWLNGREIFLKGVNRHEQSEEFGVCANESQMVRDLQILKGLGANFIRAAHYQQDPRFLSYCDEIGMLVWEESLGWGNGQDYTQEAGRMDIEDPVFCEQQVVETREMVRASFNHPSVIVYAFLNECASDKPACKKLVDRLIDTIRAEDSGRLVTFACNLTTIDICNERTDLVAINAYPGTIPARPGTPEELKAEVGRCFDRAAAHMRRLHPDKPIIVSESGCGAYYGRHDPCAAFGSEEFQDEYLADILETIWANPDYVGFAIWQFSDTNTHRRNSGGARSGRMLGISTAGIVDFQRRPKKACETVRRFFSLR